MDNTCLLCGNEAANTVLYRSKDGGKVFGAPEGKTRYIVYHLCARCASNRQLACEWAEAHIHAFFGDEGYQPKISAIGEEAGHAS